MFRAAEARVATVQAGGIAPLGPQGVASAFVKHAVRDAVRVGTLGLEGDVQADRRVHGGPDKAVYAYAASRYGEWLVDFPELADRFVPGGFGENLTIEGMTEDDLCVGDVHGIGTVRLQVCQPRQPCFKLALRFDDKRIPRAMMRNGRSGWYYRVLTEGILRAGDAVALVDRPLPDFPFNALLEFLYARGLEDTALERVASADVLPRSLRTDARRELAARRGGAR